MNDSSEDLAAVGQLLAEADSLRGWLTRLDQAQAGVPDAVRTRVRADYQHRLDQLTAGLRAHADTVSAKLADDRQEHADLLARATNARDGLAEAELRHAVGEYDSDRFQGEQRRFNSDIETFELALGAAAERIARLAAIQAAVDSAPRPMTDEVEPGVRLGDEVAEARTVTITELAPDSDDGLAVFDEQEGVGDSVAPPSAPESGPLSFRPSGGSGEWPRPVSPPPTRTRPFESAPPLGIPAADVPPRFIRPGERLSSPPAAPAAVPPVVERVAEPPVVAVREVTPPLAPAPEASAAAPGKTLRCGECGAMNRPLEWYCEKCGAELTAV